jgi:SAM-dependent methyltransferase
MTSTFLDDYIFGDSDKEHHRLTTQARTLETCSERLLRAAGLSKGMSVLDVGCGVGDFSLLAGRLVGPGGSVVGIDRDRRGLRLASRRAAEAGAHHVRFEQGALESIRLERRFDAVIGRFVLMFAPDPAAALNNLLECLKPGGLVIFQEPSWSLFFTLAEDLPARSACGRWICQILRQGGARPDMGVELYGLFKAVQLRDPRLLVEVPMADAEGAWIVDLMDTLRQRAGKEALEAGVGVSFAELAARLAVEAQQSATCPPQIGMVGAWARKDR